MHIDTVKTEHKYVPAQPKPGLFGVPHLLLGDIVLTVETVTPEIAKRWLEHNICNRKLRPSVVSQYARDMLSGKWHEKPVAICFDKNGNTGNGQHTLNGIVQSGIPQTLLVARNCSHEAIAAMDIGLRRTVSDVAHFIGENIDNRKAAIVRVMLLGPTYNTGLPKASFSEILEFYQTHRDVIDAVSKMAPIRIGVTAVVLAVCARALYSEDEAKIARFIEVLTHGIADGPHENAAIRLRDFMRGNATGSNSSRPESYWKSVNALRNFLDGKPISKLYATEQEHFPLP